MPFIPSLAGLSGVLPSDVTGNYPPPLRVNESMATIHHRFQYGSELFDLMFIACILGSMGVAV